MARMEPTLGMIDIDAYSPPAASLQDEPARAPRAPRLFDFSGRLSLSRYWLLHLVFCCYISWGLLLVLFLGLRHNLYALVGAGLAVMIPSALVQASLLMRRARDVGMHPGWGLAALLVPLLGHLLWLYLGLMPGSRGANRFGAANPPLARGYLLLIPLLLVSLPGAVFWVWLSHPEWLVPLAPYF